MARWTPQMVMPKINSYLAAGSLEYRPASRSWYYEKQPLSEREVAKRMAYLIGCPVCHAELAVSVRGMELADASRNTLQGWVSSLEAQADSATSPLHAVLARDALYDFINCIAREDTEDELLWCHNWAMRQWIWQTKRNIMGLPVTWHVTPIFWSKENGTGKTYNLQRLLAPVEGFLRHMSVDELGEKFSKKLLSQTHVVMFDEFAKASEADIATFKAMITGRPLEGREMYSEGGFYAENRLSCIATSNLVPPHGFEDTSGARRFWSIHCHSAGANDKASRARMEILDGLNWEAIWNCVSVTTKSMHLAMPDGVKARMEVERKSKMRARDSFEVFVEECVEKGVKEDRIPFKELIDAYRNWCAHTNHNRLKASLVKTAERLEDLGFLCTNSSNKRFLCGHRLTGETL